MARIGTTVKKANAMHARGGYAADRWSRVMRNIRRSSWFYAMFALPLAYFMIFHYLPMFGILIAFQRYDVYSGFISSPWVGLRFFQQFLTDAYFYQLLRNTILLGVLELVFVFPTPIVFALLLNELTSVGYRKIVQTVSYMPYFLSMVVVVGIVVNFLASDGPVNNLLRSFSIPSIPFMSRAEWFRPVYIVSHIWQNVGWGSIIYLAAITNIDPQLYEAATIDGANRWQQAWRVTLPSISPTITILLVLAIGNILSVSFEKVLLLYNPAVYETADIISTYVYRRGIVGADYSFAAAVGLFNSVVAFLFLWGANRSARRLSETSLW